MNNSHVTRRWSNALIALATASICIGTSFAEGHSAGNSGGYSGGHSGGYSGGHSSGYSGGHSSGYSVGHASAYSGGHAATRYAGSIGTHRGYASTGYATGRSVVGTRSSIGSYRGGYPSHGGYPYGHGNGHGYGYGYGHGHYGGWGGLGFGLYFAALPFYYSTLWWDGIPYYYDDYNYYLWNPGVSEYETVPPPPTAPAQAQDGSGDASYSGAAVGSGATDVFAYPKNGQSEQQQTSDRVECHKWAADQNAVGASSGGSSPSAPSAQQSDYMRALTACLEGRGYSEQ